MRAALVLVLSFLCLVDVRDQAAMTHNVLLGCEPFTVWENAQHEPRYYILHCPDEAWGKVKADGRWADGA